MISRNTIVDIYPRLWDATVCSRYGQAASGQEGFTLVEMLVVIAIIGLIMGLIGPRVLNYLSEIQGQDGAHSAAELFQRARPVLSRCRPLPVHGGRTCRAGAADTRVSRHGMARI